MISVHGDGSSLLLLLLPFLLSFVTLLLSYPVNALESSRQFKVMTLNALNFVDGPNWDKRIYEIKELIINNDPDCVAFEEIRKDKNCSMLVNNNYICITLLLITI